MLRLQASRAYLWSRCPGSTFAPPAAPRPLSDSKIEGKAGHELLALSITGDPAEYLGKMSTVGIPYDQEMVDGVRLFQKRLGDVNQYTNSWSERELSVVHEGVEVVVRPDCVAWCRHTATLFVYEYKYGHKIVEPYENEQLCCAAAIYNVQLKLDAKNFVLIVVQPRGHHPDGDVREWRVTKAEIDKNGIGRRLYDAAINCGSEHPTFIPGPHCKSCRGAGPCSVLMKEVGNVMSDVAKKKYEDLPPSELAAELSNVNRQLAILQARQEALQSRAFDLINSGKRLKNFMVAPGKNTRFWKDEEQLKVIEMMYGVKLHKSLPVTVKAAEGLELPKEVLTDLIGRGQGKPQLVECDLTIKAKKVFDNV